MRISDWSSDVCSSDLGRDRAHDFRQMAKPALVIGDERAPYRRSLIAPDLAKQSRELAVQTIQSALFGTSNPTHLIVEPPNSRQKKRVTGSHRQELEQSLDRRRAIGIIAFVERERRRGAALARRCIKNGALGDFIKMPDRG